MLNTVPRGVQLTDVITPIPVKPDNVQLILDGDTLKLIGEVRVCGKIQLRSQNLIAYSFGT